MNDLDCDVLIIGAGPSGSLAGARLAQEGFRVRIVERDAFPRFSIGESLLPQSMEFLERAGLLQTVVEGGYQHKNGAAFSWAGQETFFDFRDKFSAGWGTTYQVPRADFDDRLARQAAAYGADVQFRQTVERVDFDTPYPIVETQGSNGGRHRIRSRFVLDASGFGRVLPRLLELEEPTDFPVRQAIFTHIEDRIGGKSFDRNKILIAIHPQHVDVWYWLIPFSDGRASIGVVAEESFFDRYPGESLEKLQRLANEEPTLRSVLADARWDTPARAMSGYSCRSKQLHGRGYALLGNAAEFLDPVFSSGVTIALKSADLASSALSRQLRGETVDWDGDYSRPLQKGVSTFKTFVESWYRGGLQRIFFNDQRPAPIRERLCAILAGYAWDMNNTYVAESERRIRVLEQVCADSH